MKNKTFPNLIGLLKGGQEGIFVVVVMVFVFFCFVLVWSSQAMLIGPFISGDSRPE